jgi:cytochrome c-type biogenesis protein CcmH/NrfF
MDRLFLKKKKEEGGRGLLLIEVTCKEEMINIAEYFKTKYQEDQFVNIVKSHECNQPNMNSTIKMAAEIAKELNQSNENSDTKRKAFSA